MTFKAIARLILSALMATAGVFHFVHPVAFINAVPSYLPNASTLVSVSGVFEVLGAIGLLIPQTRRFSGIGLIALFIAVFPANVNMAIHANRFSEFPPIALWIRLPLQIVLIAWAWWVRRGNGSD